jgi:hypothetical protein
MTTIGCVRRQVERAKPGTFFHVAAIHGPRPAVETAFSRLAREGRLVRVRKGLYWKGVESRFGAGRPAGLEVAIEIAGHRGVGPAGWTATNVLGLSTQVPPVVDVAVLGRTPLPVPGVRFHARANLDRWRLTFHEIAVLEALREWPRTSEVGWVALVEIVHDLEARALVNRARIDACARREPPAVRAALAELAAA